MTANELADQIQVPVYQMAEILAGQCSITGDIALRLGHFFGTSANFWMNLQTLYELRTAEIQAGNTIKALPTLVMKLNLRPDGSRLADSGM